MSEDLAVSKVSFGMESLKVCKVLPVFSRFSSGIESSKMSNVLKILFAQAFLLKWDP